MITKVIFLLSPMVPKIGLKIANKEKHCTTHIDNQFVINARNVGQLFDDILVSVGVDDHRYGTDNTARDQHFVGTDSLHFQLFFGGVQFDGQSFGDNLEGIPRYQVSAHVIQVQQLIGHRSEQWQTFLEVQDIVFEDSQQSVYVNVYRIDR